MPNLRYTLAIDQGTTSTRAILFNEQGSPESIAQLELRQHYPRDGWVEHDPEEIWASVLNVCREVLARHDPTNGKVVAVGLTNQRETTLIWDRATGQPIYNAIVWQDRRTADACKNLSARNLEATVTAKTGLVIDPYFSATKIGWILDHVPGARRRAERGDLAFGTIDTFLLWRLTGGKVHATDITNASRTSLFNIHTQQWDEALLKAFEVPSGLLPEVKECAADFGTTDPTLFGIALPIGGIVGDQQAAAIGQGCFSPGMVKSTYGTGCFVLLNTGDKPVISQNRLLTTIAYRVDGRTSYAIEGAIFVAGAAVQWLRDGLGLIRSAAETDAIARSLPGNQGVFLVPAFTGLGAPHWNTQARAAIFGMTRDTGPRELVRAALESVCYQTHDLLQAMADDNIHLSELRVDGGMVTNNWLMQFLADILTLPVDRPAVTETTALGAACLAGLYAGIYRDLNDIGERWIRDTRYTATMHPQVREELLTGWHTAVRRVCYLPE